MGYPGSMHSFYRRPSFAALSELPWDERKEQLADPAVKAKILAVAMIVIFGGYAIGVRLENIYLRVIGGAFCLIGLIYVLRIPVCPRSPRS